MDKAVHPTGDCPGPGVGARLLRPALREAGMEYWRIERVARYLDVSKKRVYQLVYEKRLAAIRLGPRQMRVLRQSLDDYLQALIEAGIDD